jgi:hypothetical protein
VKASEFYQQNYPKVANNHIDYMEFADEFAASKDDPEADGTDFAHPAYWRGHDQATYILCQMINEILDGKDDGAGVSREPWESTRRRLLELAERK